MLLSFSLFPVVYYVMRTNLDVVVVISLTIPILGGFSNFLGAFVPFGLTKAGFDPAVIAAPFMTTVVDTMGLVIYFVVAKVVFGALGVHGPEEGSLSSHNVEHHRVGSS